MRRTLHPRYFIVASARIELSNHLLVLMENDDLTFAEVVLILAELQQTWAQRAVKEERAEEPKP